MRIAFYAPMKAPTDPVPSGDRAMARALWSALEEAGHELTLAADFRTWEGQGDAVRQRRLQTVGRRLAARLVRRYRAQTAATRPQIWFSYHLYHKAPDWLGPSVSAALGIPYVVAEASYAPKQAGGPWALGHEAVAAALARANAVVALNSNDIPCVRPLLRDAGRLLYLKPFIDADIYSADGERAAAREALAAALGLDPRCVWLLAVAMMRPGDKLTSYRLLAQALTGLRTADWCLLVAGDGPARPQVQSALSALAPERVRLLGRQTPAALRQLYGACDLLVWPAVNEAYGMALLEAQAGGLPVVAGRYGGVADVVQDGVSGLLSPPGDTRAFAHCVQALLRDPKRRARMGAAGAQRARAEHDIAFAGARLDRLMRTLLPEVAA